MNCETVGQNIAKLRKQHNLTQQDLAERLDVTDKAISRWENGVGYPDVTIFPRLAEIFGVSVDYLMAGEKRGITIAGNMLLDVVKSISDYPACGLLTHINSVSYAVGGCAPNTAVNLAKIDGTVPVSVIGKLGTDEYGKFVLNFLQKNGLDVSRVIVSDTLSTSFTDVMSIPSGERTFFYQKGANKDFSPADIDISTLNCDIFHIGYILLLDAFDAEDPEYGTVMARFLHDLQKAGIKTSVDMVSDSMADYSKKVLPALKYCDYVIINEIECCRVWNLNAYDENGKLDRAAVAEAMRKTMDAGVRDRVIIHCKEQAFAMNADRVLTEVPSLKIPREEIKGSVGAGDAFCAASLYGIYNNYTDKHLLEFASAAAACNLFAENSVDGMRPKSEILKVAEKYGRLELQ